MLDDKRPFRVVPTINNGGYSHHKQQYQYDWIFTIYAYNIFAGLEGDDFFDTKFELRNGEVIEAKTKADCLYHQFMRIISECPMGTELFVRVSTNYEQLATIYKQRKNHKLKEDWGEFVKFVNSLPYSKELITCEKEVNNE